MSLLVVFGGGIFTSAFENPYFTRLFFRVAGRFGPVWVDFIKFRELIFRFSSFFSFQIRYTRTEDGRLMYSPSENRVEAGQLGPKGCCFYFCGFRHKTVGSLYSNRPRVLAAGVHGTGGTHSAYSLVECEEGGTRHTFYLFFTSILGCQVSEFSLAELT
jgi:hypothetical protein